MLWTFFHLFFTYVQNDKCSVQVHDRPSVYVFEHVQIILIYLYLPAWILHEGVSWLTSFFLLFTQSKYVLFGKLLLRLTLVLLKKCHSVVDRFWIRQSDSVSGIISEVKGLIIMTLNLRQLTIVFETDAKYRWMTFFF